MSSKATWDFSKENEKTAKRKAKKMKEQSSGGGAKLGNDDRLKLEGGVNRIFICQPWDSKGEVMKRVMVHQVWKNKKPIATAACPRINEGDDCPVCQYGWDLSEKYKQSKSQRKQNLWRLFKATQDYYVNAIDLTSKDKRPKVLKLPHNACELLLEEINDDDVSLKEICHLDEGRAMRIKGNGKNGNARRYEIVKFEKAPVNLVSNNEVDEEKVLNGLFNLDKLQPKSNDKKLAEVLTQLKKQALSEKGDEDEEEEDQDEDTDDEDSDDEDSDADGDDDDDEDEEEEKPAKKKPSKKKPADDEEEDSDDEDSDDDDEDEEDDSDDEDSDDDDEDEESDEDDDSDDDDEDEEEEESDDDDEDEEEEEKPAKSKSKVLKKKK